MREKGSIFRFSVVGLLLVTLGILFLLNNLGVLPWSVWATLWRFWPVLLILIGLGIILGGRAPWLVLGVSVALILSVIVAAVVIHGRTAEQVTSSFSQPLQGIKKARIDIDFGAGELVMGNLPDTSPNLVEGTGSPDVQQDFRSNGDTGNLRLNVPGRRFFWGGRGFRLEALITTQVPLELNIKSGATNGRLDLTRLKVNDLTVETGASQLELLLPASAGSMEAVVKSGVARIDIVIPRGVAARITSSGGLTSTNVDTLRFPRMNGRYESPDFATAANRINLSISAGVSQVDIR